MTNWPEHLKIIVRLTGKHKFHFQHVGEPEVILTRISFGWHYYHSGIRIGVWKSDFQLQLALKDYAPHELVEILP